MNTETLKGFGLDDEQIKNVMAEHGKVFNRLKQEKEAAEQERDALKTQVEDVNAKLSEAQKNADKGSEYAEQIKTLQDDLANAKTESEKQLAETKLGYELDAALSSAGALNAKATKALLDLDKVQLVDGKLTGLDEQLKAVKADNAFLFQPAENPGKPQITPPGNPDPSGGKKDDLEQALGL